MKENIVAFLILIIPNIILGQCIVDAGENQNLCPEEIRNNPKLDGQIINGDVVQLIWESEYAEQIFDKTFFYTASSMLNDTTILNPIIEQHFEKSVKYVLKGVTVNNEVCVDSVIVNFSDWTFLTIDKITNKHPTDTIQLWEATQSSWPHIRYEWSPNYMISDTTVKKPFVWNNETTFYNLKITDSIGCFVIDDVFEVYTNTTSTSNIKDTSFKIFPNPVSSMLQIKGVSAIRIIEIYSIDGKKLLESKKNYLDLSKLLRGLYIIKITTTNNETISKIIQKINE